MKAVSFDESSHIKSNDITNIQNYLDMDFSNFPVKEFREIVCHGDEEFNDVIKMTVPFDCWDESHHKESNLFNKLRSRINEYREHLIQFERLVPSEDVEEDDLSLKIAELEKQLEILKAAQAIVNKR